MRRAQDREILRLAVPAFLALVAEPMFLLSDAAIVGHLGTPELAGLGIAGVVLQTVVGLCVFLAYGTTAGVARRLGAGDRRGALAQGVDGLWLAVDHRRGRHGAGDRRDRAPRGGLRRLARGDRARHDVPAHRLPRHHPLLLMLAATGVLRGLQDTRTPLVVAVAGNALNIVLNLLLVYGVGPVAGLGLPGSALGSVLAQVASAAALLVVVIRGARRDGASLRPHPAGHPGRAGRAGVPLVIRTLTLRAALLVTTYAVTLGAVDAVDSSVDLATHQLAHHAVDLPGLRAGRHRDRRAGDHGAAAGLRRHRGDPGPSPSGWCSGGRQRRGHRAAPRGRAVPCWAACSPTDPAVARRRSSRCSLVAALAQPIAGVVFVLDGVLIGAGDGRYLARGGLVTLVVYAPVVLLVARRRPGGGVGQLRLPSSWARAWWCWCTAPAATPGW